MSEDKIILIAGDSWACGEWLEHSVIHGGLTDYLIDQHYKVINLGRPGGSNDDSITRIEDFLNLNKNIIIKNIIVFQTEWTRSNILDIDSEYTSLREGIISKFYYNLSRLSTKFNTTTHIIGGCSDTIWIDLFEINYPGVNVACQSFTNLILTNNHRICSPVYSLMTNNNTNSDKIEYFKKQFNQYNLKLLLDDIDQGHARLDIWSKNKEFFWPDGVHPNRAGHKILFNFLKNQGIFDEQR